MILTKFITDYEICARGQAERALWAPALDRHIALFQHAPLLAVADGGFASRSNERAAADRGVRHVVGLLLREPTGDRSVETEGASPRAASIEAEREVKIGSERESVQRRARSVRVKQGIDVNLRRDLEEIESRPIVPLATESSEEENIDGP